MQERFPMSDDEDEEDEDDDDDDDVDDDVEDGNSQVGAAADSGAEGERDSHEGESDDRHHNQTSRQTASGGEPPRRQSRRQQRRRRRQEREAQEQLKSTNGSPAPVRLRLFSCPFGLTRRTPTQKTAFDLFWLAYVGRVSIPTHVELSLSRLALALFNAYPLYLSQQNQTCLKLLFIAWL